MSTFAWIPDLKPVGAESTSSSALGFFFLSLDDNLREVAMVENDNDDNDDDARVAQRPRDKARPATSRRRVEEDVVELAIGKWRSDRELERDTETESLVVRISGYCPSNTTRKRALETLPERRKENEKVQARFHKN